MTEKEMEDLLWQYPERFFNEPLKQFERQMLTGIGRPDIVFADQFGRLLIVEVKKGTLERAAIGQLLDYFGAVKLRHPDRPVEMIVVANAVPPERKLACEQYHIECREIPEFKFRAVAAEVGYSFKSESKEEPAVTPDIAQALPASSKVRSLAKPEIRKDWEQANFSDALSVVDECFEILQEIDPRLTPVYDVFIERPRGKIRIRRFVSLGINGIPICPLGTQSHAQPLRFELHKKGSVKLSAPTSLRDEWDPSLRQAAFEVSDKRTDRLIVSPVWRGKVGQHRTLTKDFFQACLTKA